MLRDEIHDRHDLLVDIAARHGASNLKLFGSVGRGEDSPDSDVDRLIDLAEDRGFANYPALADAYWPGTSS